MPENAFNPIRGLPDKPVKKDHAGADSLDPADRELFLAAVKKMPSPNKDRGFLLGEQCQLPNLKMKKKLTVLSVPKEKLDPPAEDLFAVAMRNTVPLAGKGRAVPSPKPVIPRRSVRELTLADYMAEKLEFAVSSSDEYMEGHVVGMDSMITERLRQGQFSPEAHLDLHGQNMEQAFEALKEFIRQAWFKGLHTVLVIPGRGKNSVNGMGILRQQLPYWLTHEPFKRVVLAFCTAQPHDGGPGSIYVLLRKFKKKGPVRWNTLAFHNGDS